MWSITYGWPTTSVFLLVLRNDAVIETAGKNPMDSTQETKSNVAQQIAQAAIAFQQQRTGHVPQSVAVILDENTLVVTLRGVLSPAEQILAKSPEGAAQIQMFHRQLFASSSEPLRQEIKRITGSEVREATAEIEPTTGTVVQVFTNGTMVQVFMLAQSVPADSWSGHGKGEQVATTEISTC
jgi:uncharacterized protein YbcI